MRRGMLDQFEEFIKTTRITTIWNSLYHGPGKRAWVVERGPCGLVTRYPIQTGAARGSDARLHQRRPEGGPRLRWI